MNIERRREMVGRERHKLSLSRRCRLLGISRGSLYYRPRGESRENGTDPPDRERISEDPWYGGGRHLAFGRDTRWDANEWAV